MKLNWKLLTTNRWRWQLLVRDDYIYSDT